MIKFFDRFFDFYLIVGFDKFQKLHSPNVIIMAFFSSFDKEFVVFLALFIAVFVDDIIHIDGMILFPLIRSGVYWVDSFG
jgi:hypothetical protein